MRSGFKVGRIFGINIHIDWSWIFIFLLAAPVRYPALAAAALRDDERLMDEKRKEMKDV